MLFVAERRIRTTGKGTRCHAIPVAIRSHLRRNLLNRYLGGSVISMAQMAAGRMYMEAR